MARCEDWSTGTLESDFEQVCQPTAPQVTQLWYKKVGNKLHSPANIIIAGDLNLTLAPCEKKGGARGKYFMQDAVENMIHDWDLVYVKPMLGRITWSNQRVFLLG